MGKRRLARNAHWEWLVPRLSNEEIVCVGAFDRFNFGDLLFPLVLDHVARAMHMPPLAHYALRSADMTQYGGIQPQAITGPQARPIEMGRADGFGLVLGGGEILGATWGAAATSLLPVPLDFGLLAVRHLISHRLFDRIGKAGLRGKWPTPYVPDLDIAHRCTLVANAIGASSLLTLNPKAREAVVAALKAARYVSVRDTRGRQLLRREGIESTLAPDSVAILAKIHYPTSATADGTLVFQCSRAWLRSRLRPTLDAIVALSRHFSRILLLPIGLAGGHDDRQALRIIRRAAKSMTRLRIDLAEVVSVWDIADAIAQSSAFVGTSLHGNIAAMAHGVPSVGLEGVRKLDSYIDTWGEGLTPFAISPTEVYDAVLFALASDHCRRVERASSHAELSWKNSTRVLRCAAGYSDWRDYSA